MAIVFDLSASAISSGERAGDEAVYLSLFHDITAQPQPATTPADGLQPTH